MQALRADGRSFGAIAAAVREQFGLDLQPRAVKRILDREATEVAGQ